MVQILLKYRWIASIFFVIAFGILMQLRISEQETWLTSVIQNLLLVLLFVFWFLLLGDMLRSKIKDKMFWVVSMFLMPFLAPVIYLFQKKRLLAIKMNKFSGSSEGNDFSR